MAEDKPAVETPSAPDGMVVVTYNDIRNRYRLGGLAQARVKAKRAQWQLVPRNNPAALAHILIPKDEWERAGKGKPSASGYPVSDTQESNTVRALEAAIDALKEAQAQAELRGIEVQRERDEALARANRAEGEVDGLKTASEHLHEVAAQARRDATVAQERAIFAEQQAAAAKAGELAAKEQAQQLLSRGLFARVLNSR